MAESRSWLERLRGFLSSSEEEPELEEEPEEEPELEVTEQQRRVVAEAAGKTVEEVVGDLMGSGLNKVEASRVVYYLSKRGKIMIRDPNPPQGLGGYFLSVYSLWFWAVVGFMAVTTSAVYLLPQADPWIYLRYIFGAVYVLYVPGAVFIEALYAKRKELEDLERFALGVGLSLAIVPLVGLVLNYTPWGIRLDPIYASLSLLTLGLGLVGVYRKYEYHSLGLEAER